MICLRLHCMNGFGTCTGSSKPGCGPPYEQAHAQIADFVAQHLVNPQVHETLSAL